MSGIVPSILPRDHEAVPSGATFPLRDRIIAAIELGREAAGHVPVTASFLASLGYALLHTPLDELQRLRAELAATYPEAP